MLIQYRVAGGGYQVCHTDVAYEVEYPGQIIRLLQQFRVALLDNNELHVAIRLNTFGCESLVNNNLILSSVHTNGHPVCLRALREFCIRYPKQHTSV